jgi:GNAT superfamily N-acetyltransferase
MEPTKWGLGTTTSLFVPRFEGHVLEQENYLVIRSPSNPTHYWGNYLVLERPPQAHNFAYWLEVFAAEIGTPPTVNHILLAWDQETPHLEPHIPEGFTLEHSVVLAATAVHAPNKVNLEAEIRPIVSDTDWAHVLECQVAARDPQYLEAPYRSFKEQSMARYRRMAEAGHGLWFGAFLQGQVVADMGIFYEGTVGRFQAVGTDPRFRRMGLCGTLVWRVAQFALERWNLETLVMIADESYHAAKIYESVGFKPVEHTRALMRDSLKL